MVSTVIQPSTAAIRPAACKESRNSDTSRAASSGDTSNSRTIVATTRDGATGDSSSSQMREATALRVKIDSRSAVAGHGDNQRFTRDRARDAARDSNKHSRVLSMLGRNVARAGRGISGAHLEIPTTGTKHIFCQRPCGRFAPFPALTDARSASSTRFAGRPTNRPRPAVGARTRARAEMPYARRDDLAARRPHGLNLAGVSQPTVGFRRRLQCERSCWSCWSGRWPGAAKAPAEADAGDLR